MLSKNILNIIIIFILVGFIIYSFYNCNQIITDENESITTNTTTATTKLSTPVTESYAPTIMSDQKLNDSYTDLDLDSDLFSVQTPRKKVSFDPNIQYYDYKTHSPPGTITNPKNINPISKLNFRSDLKTNPKINLKTKTNPKTKIETKTKTKATIDRVLKENEFSPKINLAGNIIPSNFDIIDPNQKWDSSFGLPLMEKKEQAAYFAAMMNNYSKFTDTLDRFGQYVTDQSTIIKTETTIDPFKPSTKSCQLDKKTVQEIYDKQVQGPQIVQKKIKSRTLDGIIYDNESELNGGKMSGTDVVGASGIGKNFGDTWESASFGNGFYNVET